MCGTCQLSAHPRPDPAREYLETFVGEMFRCRYGATVRSFMPLLLALRHGTELRGVTGYRHAGEEPLYLERYLDRPVDGLLQDRTGSPVARTAIAEIGNFACSDGRSAAALLGLLPDFLLDRGHGWVVFTATRAVRRMVSPWASRLLDLGPADPAMLAGAMDDWGRYYETAPRVLAGCLIGLGTPSHRLEDRHH